MKRLISLAAGKSLIMCCVCVCVLIVTGICKKNIIIYNKEKNINNNNNGKSITFK